MIESKIWKSGAAALALIMCGLATAQPVGYDFNDDGFSDYPVSIFYYDDTNPDVGAARIWSGASKSIIHTIVGSDTNTLFGWSSGSAGDLNADGKDDLIVGEPLWGTPQSQTPTHQGRVTVISGADASTLLTINGPYVDAAIGRYVTGIGDWDGDGTIDIASSGWDIADTDNDGIGDDPIGMVFIFSGADGSLLTEIVDTASTSGFGYSVFSIGDITGNSKADIAVVDRRMETGPGTGIYGQLYIFEGSATETVYDLTDAYRTISNTDPTIRGYAAQVDVMHPDLWLNEPTLQIINLTDLGSGGVNEAQIAIDIMKTDGVLSGTKGTRSSLQLAGDVNLDGKVDAADLQDSISQLGTDPQAIGVMPIADTNKDGIIDATDIQVVVNGYGATTDIYEGLWDGSRLLSLAAGSAGFGSTSNISVNPIGGGTQFGGGRRPIDDCLRSTSPPGWTGSIVPDLLRVEAADNCNSCPDCDEPDPRDCYECSQKGNVTGGEITVSPSQPEPGEQVTFTISKWQVNGRKEKCKSSCGDEGTECDIDVSDRQPHWVLEKKNANGDWVEIDSGNSPTVTRTENACAELRLRLPETTLVGPVDDCDELKTSEEEKEVQFANFTLSSSCVADTPGPKSRTTVGIGEEVDISVVEQNAGTPRWEVNGEDRGTHPSPYRVQAQESKGSMKVVAEINGCRRMINLTVLEPSQKNYTVCATTVHHVLGKKDIGVYYKMDLDPDTVSFYNIAVREGTVAASELSGDYQANGAPAHPLGNWHYVREDNTVIARDHAFANLADDDFDQGGFSWKIPFEYAVAGGTIIHTPSNKYEKQKFTVTTNCVKVSKGGFTTPLGCRTGATITPNFTGCGINGQ